MRMLANLKKVISKNLFLKNSILYTIGSMMTPAIGLILLPVYTNYLTPAEYGTMTTVQTLAGMLQLIMVLSLHGAITRFYYDFLDDHQEQKKYLGSIVLFVLIYSFSMLIMLLVFKPFLGGLLFQNISVDPFYTILLVLSFTNALISLPMALIRAQEKAWLFISINAVKGLLITCVSIYLLVIRGSGPEGPLYAHIFIGFIILVVYFMFLRKDIKFSFSIRHIKESLKFSLPLLPHVASAWVIQASDRFILEKYVSLSELGLYSLAAQMSMVLSIFYTSINHALVPRYTKLRTENENDSAKKVLNYFFWIVMITGAIVILCSGLLLHLLVSDEYYSARNILVFLVIGQVLKGFYFIPVARLFFVKRTKSIAISSLLAALINIVLNIILIPSIGVWGAVISTIVAEFMRLFLNISTVKKIDPVKH